MLAELKLLGVVGLAAAGWYVLQTHDAGIRRACNDAHSAAAAAELKTHTEAVTEIAHEAQRMQARLAADHAGAAVAAERLRGAVAGSGLVIRAAAAGASAPAGDVERMSAELLERAVSLARIADERGAAGAACQRAYDTLTAPR